ncbi:MAG: serine/threonine-protein kinase [Gemmatimonadaceae bacterium]|jgi:serine/threonine-protein kinase|nr:serine/threonine-protein kinase [Gemmatimonadaceae bacterium]
MTISPDDWARITTLFGELAPLPAAERAARLATLARTERAIATEVAALLAADADDGFLDHTSIRRLFNAPMPTSLLLGRTLGAYRIEREIGRGGMGIVYEGRHLDPSIDKRVAIKTLAIGLDRPEMAWRFRREQRILARLEHPHIAALYDGGTTAEGIPYLVMEYVEGVRIDHWCDAQRLTVPQRLDLFRQVCAAVAYAHTKLIIHRDLKPSNILVTTDGVVKLLDFGIATLTAVDDEHSGDPAERTRPGLTPFTTQYASPEQARGGEITSTADVYSLGLILFKLLTGRSPADELASAHADGLDHGARAALPAPSDAVTDAHAMHCRVESPAALRSILRGELDAIIGMALREEPARRYPGAAALSADLHRYLRALPIEARADTRRYRLAKFVQRQRTLAVAVAVAAVALIAGTAASVISARKAIAEAERTRRLASILQGIVGAGASSSYRQVPTLLTVLDSARARLAVEFSDDARARADAYALFGMSYFQFERPDLALLMLDSARVLHGRVLGPSSVDVARALANSSGPLFALGQTDSAVARLRTSVQLLRSVRPPAERERAAAEIELAFVEINLLSRPDSGLPRLASALPLARRIATPDWDVIGMGEAVTIMPYHYLGQAARAESAFIRARDALARDSGTSNAQRSGLAFAGQSLLLRGRAAEAEPLIRQLLRVTELRLGHSHYLTAQAQNLLARVMMELGRFREGLVLVDSAIANNVSAPARDPLYLGEMYVTRAGFEITTRDWSAVQRSLAAAKVQQARLGATQQPILEVSVEMATGALLEAQGQIPAARAAFTRAADIAHAALAPGARNRGLADQRLAAFALRHPLSRSTLTPR